MMFKSIGYRIAIGYSVLVVTGIVTGIIAIVNFSELGSSVNAIFKQNYQSLIIAENMLRSLDQQENTLLSIMADESQYEDNSGYARIVFREGRDEFLGLFQKAMDAKIDTSKASVLDSLMLAYKDFLVYADSLDHMAKDGLPITTLRNFQRLIIRPQCEKLKDYCFQVLELNQNAISGIDVQARNNTREAAYTIGAALLVNLLFSVFAGVYFSRSVARPLSNLTRSVKRISEGHLNQKIDIRSGDEIGVLSAEFNKMTERLRNYEELNIQKLISEKKKSEAIIHSISDPVIVTDTDSRVVLCNRAADQITMSLFRSGWQERPVQDSIDEQRWRELFAYDIGGIRQDNQPELVLPLPIAGETKYFRPRQTIIVNEYGAPAGMITLLQDVTRFKNVDELKSEFMATVSHELRTPLTSLNMAVGIMRQGLVGEINSRQLELLDGAKFDCDRLIKLVGDLLDLTRLESGKYEVRRQLILVSQLLQHALQPFQLALKQRCMSVTMAVNTTHESFIADFDQLLMVLTNLINNALRHMQDGGALTIAVEDAGRAVRFCIADTGPGIPAQDLEHIFDRFVQLKDQVSSTPGSVGLGLAIARKSIEMQGGKIWAESDFGQGSRFYFTLPIDTENADA